MFREVHRDLPTEVLVLLVPGYSSWTELRRDGCLNLMQRNLPDALRLSIGHWFLLRRERHWLDQPTIRCQPYQLQPGIPATLLGLSPAIPRVVPGTSLA